MAEEAKDKNKGTETSTENSEDKTSQNVDADDQTSKKEKEFKARMEHHKKKQKELEKELEKYKNNEKDSDIDSEEEKEAVKEEVNKSKDRIKNYQEIIALQNNNISEEWEFELLDKFQRANDYNSASEVLEDDDFQDLLKMKRTKIKKNKSPKPSDKQSNSGKKIELDNVNSTDYEQVEKWAEQQGELD